MFWVRRVILGSVVWGFGVRRVILDFGLVRFGAVSGPRWAHVLGVLGLGG